jgi:hypothetical protein
MRSRRIEQETRMLKFENGYLWIEAFVNRLGLALVSFPTVPILMDKKKLAVIHIVKKELSLSDGEYRNILERITGVRSAKDLTDNRFHKLMRYFVRTRHYRVTNKGITLVPRKNSQDSMESTFMNYCEGQVLLSFLLNTIHISNVIRWLI